MTGLKDLSVSFQLAYAGFSLGQVFNGQTGPTKCLAASQHHLYLTQKRETEREKEKDQIIYLILCKSQCQFYNWYVETLSEAKIKSGCILILIRLQVWWCHNSFLPKLSPVFIFTSVKCFNCHFNMFGDDWTFIYIRDRAPEGVSSHIHVIHVCTYKQMIIPLGHCC